MLKHMCETGGQDIMYTFTGATTGFGGATGKAFPPATGRCGPGFGGGTGKAILWPVAASACYWPLRPHLDF